MICLFVISFLAIGILVYGCVQIARASNLSIQLTNDLNRDIAAFPQGGYEPLQRSNVSMTYGNVSYVLNRTTDPYQYLVNENSGDTDYNSSVFEILNVPYSQDYLVYTYANDTDEEEYNVSVSFSVSFCISSDGDCSILDPNSGARGDFALTTEAYKITKDCSLKEGQTQCNEKGGYFDEKSRFCYTLFVATQYCVKVIPSLRGWAIDDSNGGSGCVYPFSSPSIFEQRPYTTNNTEIFSNAQFTFTIRSSDDPYISLQSLTYGKLSISSVVSEQNNTGVHLSILACVIIAVSLIVATVLFFIKRKVKREYRDASRIPHHYSRPPMFRYLALSFVNFGICIGVGFPLLSHYSEILAWTYTPFIGLLLIIYTGPVAMISLLIFWQLLLKNPYWKLRMRAMLGGVVGAAVMVLVAVSISSLMKPWRFVYSTDPKAPDQLQVFFGIVILLTFFPLATLLLVICGFTFYKDKSPESDRTKTMIASNVITYRASPGIAFGILGIFILGIVCLATAFLPPIWNVQTVGVYNTFVSPYSIVPANKSDYAVIKLYLDVAVFYGFVGSIILVGFAAAFSRRVHRFVSFWFHFKIGKFVIDTSVGELLFVLSCIGVGIWWFWWWYSGYGRIAQITDTLERLARVLGHMCNYFAAVLLFPITRNSIWVEILGIPFERAVKYHRWAGLVTFIALTGHMLVWWIKWSMDDTLLHNIFSVQNNPHADNWSIPIMELTWLGAAVMVLLSQNWFRRRRFELFYYTHHFFIVFFITGLIHAWSMWYFVGGGLILWFIDRLIRYYNSARTFPVVDVQVHNNGETTQITLQPNAFRFRAGQYAFINVPSISPLEWHPFTISSSPGDTGLTFHVKNMGKSTWTGRLASIYGHQEESSSAVINLPVVNVDGPYGNPPDFTSHENIVLVGGGIGITPLISIVKDLYQMHRQNDASHRHIKHIYLMWVVRDLAILEMFRDVFDEICNDHLSKEKFHIVLRVSQRSFSKANDGIPFNPVPILGRPNFQHDFAAIAKGTTGGVQVMVCGPGPMVDEVQSASFSFKFSFHCETFEL